MSRLDKTKDLPIYQKAELIFQLVQSLAASLPEDDEYIKGTKHLMLEDAMVMIAKIANAEGGNLYGIRMQNAAMIRNHAMHLYVQVGGLRFHESYKDLEYVKLIRNEIDAFRQLFIEWVKSFDTTNHVWDDWGLFNPPGAVPPSKRTFDDDDFDSDSAYLMNFIDFDDDDD
jgi:hypothetical protein